MHDAKTKILTTNHDQTPASVPVRGMFIEVLGHGSPIRYLGRQLSLRAEKRVEFEVDNRIRGAWAASVKKNAG